MGLSVPLEWVLGPTSPSLAATHPVQAAIVCHLCGEQQPPHWLPYSLPSILCKPPALPCPILPVHCQLAASLVTSQLRGSCCAPRSLSRLPARHHLVLCTKSASLGLFFRPSPVCPLCLEGGGQTHLSDPKGCGTQSGLRYPRGPCRQHEARQGDSRLGLSFKP